jgi:hypothetical protein
MFEQFDKTKEIDETIPRKIDTTRNTFTNLANQLQWFTQERIGGESNGNSHWN